VLLWWQLLVVNVVMRGNLDTRQGSTVRLRPAAAAAAAAVVIAWQACAAVEAAAACEGCDAGQLGDEVRKHSKVQTCSSSSSSSSSSGGGGL
jgi:hypothetical protein